MKNREFIMDLLLLFLLGLIPLYWFRPGYEMLAGYDFAIYLNPLRDLGENIFLWRERVVGGVDNTYQLPIIPYLLIYGLPLLFGMSYYYAEKIAFIVIFTLPGLSMYYMIRILFSDEKRVRLAAFIAAIYYMFNYLVMAHFSRGNLIALLVYGILPAFFALFNLCLGKKFKLKYLLSIGFLSFILSASFAHPPDFFIVPLVIFTYFLYYCFSTGNRDRRRIIKISLGIFTFLIVINFWWILPVFKFLMNFKLIPYYTQQAFTLETVKSYSINLWELLRGMGNPLYFDTQLVSKFWNEAVYYRSIFIIIGLLFPFIAYASLLFKSKNRYLAFFAGLSIIGIFLSKGVSEPLGKIYEIIYKIIPGFFIFRAPFRIFSTIYIFAWAPLIGWGVVQLIKRMRNKLLSALFISAMSCSIFIYSWPLFTGAHIIEKGNTRVIGGVFFNLPQDYKNAQTWLDSQKDYFRIYSPLQIYDVITDWGYHGINPIIELLNKPQIFYRPEAVYLEKYQDFALFINNLIKNYQPCELARILGMANIKYVILQHDLLPWSFPFENFNEYVASVLRLQKGLGLSRAIGKMEFYENQYSIPMIFGVVNAYLIKGGLEQLPLLSFTEYMERPCFFFSDQLPLEGILNIRKKASTIILDGGRRWGDNIRHEAYFKQITSNFTTGEVFVNNFGNYYLSLLKFPEVKKEKIFKFIGDSPIDLNKYPKIESDFFRNKVLKEFGKIKLIFNLDINGDLTSERKIALELLADKYYEDTGINVYELAKNELGPQDYFRVLSMQIETEKKASNADILFEKGVRFFGISGVFVSRNDKEDLSLEFDGHKFSLLLDNNQWTKIGKFDLKNKSTIFLFGPHRSSYLLRLTPASSTQHILEPKINFSKINPTKYVVDVEAAAPYFLVFSQSYHPDWNAYIEGKKIKFHYMVNGFANGYYIERMGKYKVTLEYWPQRLLVWGAIISIVGLIVLIVLFNKFKFFK